MPIHRVGVELEGGWTTMPPSGNRQMVGDSSVEELVPPDGGSGEMCDCSCECDASCRDHCSCDCQCCGDEGEACECCGYCAEGRADCQDCHVCRGESCDHASFRHKGECRPEVPLEKAAVLPWMKTNYPQAWNETCGLHVHLSFTEEWEYQALQSPIFYRDFMVYSKRKAARLKDNEIQRPRLDGHNTYCRILAPSDIRGQMGEEKYNDYRYRHLNFCWGTHGTLEFRLWGMTEPVKALSLVKGTMEFVERWLKNCERPGDAEFSGEVEGMATEGAPIRIESEEEVSYQKGKRCICV